MPLTFGLTLTYRRIRLVFIATTVSIVEFSTGLGAMIGRSYSSPGVSGAGKSSVLEGYVLPMLSQAAWQVVGIRTFAAPFTPLNKALSAQRQQDKNLLEDQARSEERQGLLAAVRALRRNPQPKVFLLFSYRSDYQSAIEELQLDDLVPRLTWMEISPFGRTAAETFLRVPNKTALAIDFVVGKSRTFSANMRIHERSIASRRIVAFDRTDAAVHTG